MLAPLDVVRIGYRTGGDGARVLRRAAAAADPAVRIAALGARARRAGLRDSHLLAAMDDPETGVRRRAAELAARRRVRGRTEVIGAVDRRLLSWLAGPATEVPLVEVAAWALGERHEGRKGTAVVPVVSQLAATATAHPDALCREAAVAALGAIGHPGGLPAILTATSDKATVRRRAVLALAPFSGPQVDAALERARGDRDWQVRQAAELLG